MLVLRKQEKEVWLVQTSFRPVTGNGVEKMKKIFFAGMLLVAIGFLAFFVTGKAVFSLGTNKGIESVRQVDSNGITQVEAVIDVGDIIVEQSPDNQIHIELQHKQADELNFEVEEKKGKLMVKVDRDSRGKFAFFNFDPRDSGPTDLHIKLPDKEFSNVQLSASVGDITVMEGKGAYEINSIVGDVELNMENFHKNVSIESDVGDVVVTTNQKPEQLNLDLHSKIGEIDVDNMETTGGVTSRSLQKESGQEQPVLKVTSEVGDIKVDEN